ncbi:MAG: O-antigen ligase family protein [Planctomycetota bacterium]
MDPRKADRTPWLVAFLFAILMYSINHDFSLPIAEPHAIILTEKVIEEGSMLRRVTFVGLAVLGFGLLAGYRHKWRIHGFVGGAFIAYLLWITASIGWSQDAFTTLKRVGTVACLCAGAAGLARHYSGAAIVKLVVATAGLLLAIGFVSALWFGTFQPWQPGFRFGGTLAPNATGLLASLFCIGALALTLYDPRRKSRYWALFIVGLGIVVLTGSRSSLAGACVGLFVFSLLSWSRERKAFVMLFGACAACALFFAYGDLIAGTLWDGLLLGRGTEAKITLTGRIPLWEQLLVMAEQKPWQGAGYFSFWTAQAVETVSHGQDWQIESAHSAYMEVLLDLGIIGLTLYCLTLFGATCIAYQRFRTRREPLDLFWLMLLVIIAVAGCLESIVPGYPGYWLQFVAFAGLWRLVFIDDRTIYLPARRVRSGFSRRAVSWKTADRPDPPLPATRG